MAKIKHVINIINKGNASMLYENDSIILRFNISFIALVIPHDGHGILNICLNKQDTFNLNMIKKINTDVIANTSINILFFLFT